MTREVIARINLSALSYNLDYVRRWVSRPSLPLSQGQQTQSPAIMAMIKSDGYGHGLLRMASALSGADAFGVASLEEALLLRGAGFKHPITVMIGFQDVQECAEFSRWNLDAVVHQWRQIHILEQYHESSMPLSIWLKIDTGMRRLGFVDTSILPLYQRLGRCSSIQPPVRIMTHFADADNTNPTFTRQQLVNFMARIAGCSGPKSVANSAGILAYPDAWFDWVRPGIMLYGVSPLMERSPLKPVMRLSARLLAIKHCKQGDVVGYGGQWCCPEDMTIGVVSIGYGDGYPRQAIHGTPTAIRGVICPIVGRVAMDMLSVDLRPQPLAVEGDEVVLWGDEQVSIEEVAMASSTIPYELLCRLSRRVKFLEV